ncbi:hypothetical protein AB0C96_19115 [Streptomyces sp. NPDC048506]|uniref:hypothetical protein n=1 Tax=Streptomyces sp. NPDC048506 TaxID=3155028 RepID=UPI003417EBBD
MGAPAQPPEIGSFGQGAAVSGAGGTSASRQGRSRVEEAAARIRAGVGSGAAMPSPSVVAFTGR